MKRTVVHLITGLGKGGAENMLYQVLKYQTSPLINYRVISMGGSSYYNDFIKELGIKVDIVSFKKHPISSLFKIKYLIYDADVLCCWMYHANFIGYIVGKMVKIKRIIWNIRHSDLSKELNKGLTLYINKWCAKLSTNISIVTYNGSDSKKSHETIGYCGDNGVVLNNGVDLEQFKPIAEARQTIGSELGITSDKKIILSVARYHPIKDIPTFIKAFVKVHFSNPQTVAVMCGNGIDTNNQELLNLCLEQGLMINQDIYLLGLRHDIPVLMSACDLYMLHSASEAFPNTLLQAMACGCICLTTNVGNAAEIIDNPERVVHPGDIVEMSQKMSYLLFDKKESVSNESQTNRNKIISMYDIKSVVRSYEGLYIEQ